MKRNLIDETRFILEKIGHNPRKRFGQNFLINEDIILGILKKSELDKDDIVIEIGPGIGHLSSYILETGANLYAIEIDRDLSKFLEERFSLYDNFNIIEDDFLKIDLESLFYKLREKHGNKKIKVIANLPYYITTPIVLKILESKLDFYSLTFMVQKEVGERFTEKNKNSNKSSITYILEYYSDPKYQFDVLKSNFYPSPNVDSAIVTLKMRDREFYIDFWGEVENIEKYEEMFFKIIKTGFLQKRKKFINSVTSTGEIDKTKIHKTIIELGFTENVRAEELSLLNYRDITKTYLKYL